MQGVEALPPPLAFFSRSGIVIGNWFAWGESRGLFERGKLCNTHLRVNWVMIPFWIRTAWKVMAVSTILPLVANQSVCTVFKAKMKIHMVNGS